MSHLLFVTSGLRGLINSSCALACRLEDAGHRITFASTADIGNSIDLRGFKFIPLEPLPKMPKDKNLLVRFKKILKRRRYPLQVLPLDKFAAHITAIKPDGILIDIELHEFIFSLIALKQPIVLLNAFLSIFKQTGNPPLHLSKTPKPGLKGKLLAELSWFKFRVWKILFLKRKAIRAFGGERFSMLPSLARELGIDLHKETDRFQWLIPFTYKNLPVLVLNAIEVDFPHAPHALTHFTGPMIELERPELDSGSQDKEKLTKLFRKKNSDQNHKFILFSCSSCAKGNVGFIKKIIESVKTETHWTMIVGLGNQLEVGAFDSLPSNVHLFNWVPQIFVLPHMDAVITNSGGNSMSECVYFGVPMVIYSLNINDQKGNAARFGSHKLGIIADIEKPSLIKGYLDQIFQEPIYRKRVKEMRERFLKYDSEQQAVQIVEKLFQL